MDDAANDAFPARRRRAARWLLWLVFVHTVPVPFLALVVGGLLPTAALLLMGLLSLADPSAQNLMFASLALGPGVVFAFVLHGAAALVVKLIAHLPGRTRSLSLYAVCLVCAALALLPVYGMGHNAVSWSSLPHLVNGLQVDLPVVAAYATGLVAASAWLAAIQAGLRLPMLPKAVVWLVPCGALIALVVVNRALLVCKPAALMGLPAAQHCVGEAYADTRNPWLAPPADESWFELAARQGHEASARRLLKDDPRSRQREPWLRVLATAGDRDAQFQLSELLNDRDNDSPRRAEALGWLRRAADAHHEEALKAMMMRADARATMTDEERRLMLERSAEVGVAYARLVLANELSRDLIPDSGSADRAFQLYDQVAEDTEVDATRRELAASLTEDLKEQRARLHSTDAEVLRHEAMKRLGLQQPAEVRALGLDLLRRAALAGDEKAWETLLGIWERGSYGFEPMPERAREFITAEAAKGNIAALELAGDGYYYGRHGFLADYVRTREVADKLITHYTATSDTRRVRSLEKILTRIERSEAHIETQLRSNDEIRELADDPDPNVQFDLARNLQLYGRAREDEALAHYRLAAAAGHVESHWRLSKLLAPPDGAAEIVAHLQAAAAGGHLGAARRLALAYANGQIGLAPDKPRALALYRQMLADADSNRYRWDIEPGDSTYEYLTYQTRMLGEDVDWAQRLASGSVTEANRVAIEQDYRGVYFKRSKAECPASADPVACRQRVLSEVQAARDQELAAVE